MKRSSQTLAEIETDALMILVERLGAGGATRFLGKYSSGHGDYTKERAHIWKGKKLPDICREIEVMKNKNKKGDVYK